MAVMDEIKARKVVSNLRLACDAVEALLMELKGVTVEAPKKGKGKAAEEPAAPSPTETSTTPPNGGEPVPHSEGGALLVKDVTIEMIRERSTEYSAKENFGMDAWLALAQKVTGQKKVKDIPKEMYGAFYAAMGDALALRKANLPNLPKPSGEPAKAADPVTVDQLRAKAKEFMGKNGEPAFVALVKAFGATKLSEIALEKRGAFLEAISNA